MLLTTIQVNDMIKFEQRTLLYCDIVAWQNAAHRPVGTYYVCIQQHYALHCLCKLCILLIILLHSDVYLLIFDDIIVFLRKTGAHYSFFTQDKHVSSSSGIDKCTNNNTVIIMYVLLLIAGRCDLPAVPAAA